jgi:hypothetical protein
MIGGMSDLVIPDFDVPAACRDCEWELGACDCLPEPPEDNRE